MARAYCLTCDEEIRTDQESHTGWSHVADGTPDDHISMKDYLGKRIKLIQMEDQYPVEPGTTGTVTKVEMASYTIEKEPKIGWCLEIDWDANRTLSVLIPPDKIELLSEEVGA